MPKKPTNAKPYRVVPAPQRAGAVIVAVARASWAHDCVETWRSNVHADTVVPRAFRLERETEPRWWRYYLTPGEAYSLSQQLREGVPGYNLHTPGTRKFAEDVERAMNMRMHDGGVSGLAELIPTPAVPTLYFLHAAGCEACEMMKPEVYRWWKVNKHRVRLVPVDLTRVEWRAKKWEPNMTPSLVVRRPDGRLSKWLEGYEPGTFAPWIEQVLR